MTWLEKMDAVINALYTHSGENPSFVLLQGWLNDKEIDKGEIQDILLHLYRKRLIYCEYNGNRDCPYTDSRDAHYLISCKGKLFWEGVGGFQQKKINDDAENSRVEKLEISQQKLMGRLNVLTGWIAGGTIALVIVELWKMAIEYHWVSCD